LITGDIPYLGVLFKKSQDYERAVEETSPGHVI
jgi:hypothetical protein